MDNNDKKGKGKAVYIVTHGDKHEGANPGMTEKGFEEVTALRKYLPGCTPLVVCGTGKRHNDVANALGIAPERYTCLAGDPDSMELTPSGKKIILSDGTAINPELYTSLEDNAPSAKAMVASLSDNSVVCAGRPIMIMLGYPKAKSASVYKIIIADGKIQRAEPVTETGVEDPALKE